LAIVEDIEEVVEGLRAFIQRDGEIELAGCFGMAEDALSELPALGPDVVIMDINLPGMNGIECLRKLKEKLPGTQFMMFTVYENNEEIMEALKAGATGYILKKASSMQIIEAIKDLHNGGAPMSSVIARKVIQQFMTVPYKQPETDPMALLTQREREILDLVAKGLLYKEIATQLGISIHTVRQHIGKIYEKLHVQNKMEAINKIYGSGTR